MLTVVPKKNNPAASMHASGDEDKQAKSGKKDMNGGFTAQLSES